MIASLTTVFETALSWITRIAYLLAPLMLRIALALPFYKSGLTKWVGFLNLSPAATFLFEEEFKLHIFGAVYSLPAPAILASVDAVAEIGLPILLIVGFGTRLSALGLLVMTGVIQLVVPDGWQTYHLPWATFAVALIAIGPGPLSLDHALHNFFLSCRPATPPSSAPRIS